MDREKLEDLRETVELGLSEPDGFPRTSTDEGREALGQIFDHIEAQERRIEEVEVERNGLKLQVERLSATLREESNPIKRRDRRIGELENQLLDNEIERMVVYLHSVEYHPDYEYATTRGPRKGFDQHSPGGEGWQRNIYRGRVGTPDAGWERFEHHEEAYWMRKIR